MSRLSHAGLWVALVNCGLAYYLDWHKPILSAEYAILILSSVLLGWMWADAQGTR